MDWKKILKRKWKKRKIKIYKDLLPYVFIIIFIYHYRSKRILKENLFDKFQKQEYNKIIYCNNSIYSLQFNQNYKYNMGNWWKISNLIG